MPWWMVQMHPRGKPDKRHGVRVLSSTRDGIRRIVKREHKGQIIDRIRKD